MAYIAGFSSRHETNMSMYGDEIVGSDGNGDIDYQLEANSFKVEAFPLAVTPEELTRLIQSCAVRDIELRLLVHPPSIDGTLKLANEFYATYLYDTDVSRIDVIDRYVTALIDILEADQDAPHLSSEEVEEYVTGVHLASAAAEDPEYALVAA